MLGLLNFALSTAAALVLVPLLLCAAAGYTPACPELAVVSSSLALQHITRSSPPTPEAAADHVPSFLATLVHAVSLLLLSPPVLASIFTQLSDGHAPWYSLLLRVFVMHWQHTDLHTSHRTASSMTVKVADTGIFPDHSARTLQLLVVWALYVPAYLLSLLLMLGRLEMERSPRTAAKKHREEAQEQAAAQQSFKAKKEQ